MYNRLIEEPGCREGHAVVGENGNVPCVDGFYAGSAMGYYLVAISRKPTRNPK